MRPSITERSVHVLVLLASSSAVSCFTPPQTCHHELDFTEVGALQGRWEGELRFPGGNGYPFSVEFDQHGRLRSAVEQRPSGDVTTRYGCRPGDHPLVVGRETSTNGPPLGWVGRDYHVTLDSAELRPGRFELVHRRAERYAAEANELVVTTGALDQGRLRLERRHGDHTGHAVLQRR